MKVEPFWTTKILIGLAAMRALSIGGHFYFDNHMSKSSSISWLKIKTILQIHFIYPSGTFNV
jgi:hypothetical protein